MKTRLWFFTMKRTLTHVLMVLSIVGLCTIMPLPSAATYTIPNNDGDCPANCRQIPWLAGSDAWNGGALPVYTGVACTVGLTEGDGTTDNTAAIEACLAAISNGQASVIPAGMFYVNATLDIPANKALRGAGSNNCSQGTWISASFHGDIGANGAISCTTLKLGDTGSVRMPGSESRGATQNLSSGYTKGSLTVTTSVAPSGIAVNDWIVISELEDSAIPASLIGYSGTCSWCGEQNAVSRPMTQIVQVTSVNGNDIGISRPLYYTFKAALVPRIMELTNPGIRAGIEAMKLWGFSNLRGSPHITFNGTHQSWAKDIETYNTPDVNGAYPVFLQYAAQNEIRDSYFHFGQVNGSGRNYGVGMFVPNSDHKIENNIIRENRHGLVQEGGGSGNVYLYNYVDDMWTNDGSYLARTAIGHGSHPYMTLIEGNIISHFGDDNIFGSSSHNVLLRNWLWGDATGNYTSWPSVTWGFVALELESQKNYMSALGNILGGTASVQNYPGHVTWNTGTVLSTVCNWGATGSNADEPHAYGFGCNTGGGTYDAAVRSTAILHGNYDYKTQGIADWDGGADHAVPISYYYVTKPIFFGNCAWPPFNGSQSPPVYGVIPARERYLGNAPCPNPPPPGSRSPATARAAAGVTPAAGTRAAR